VSTRSPPVYFLGFEICLNCRETVFAAEAADLDADRIRYRWTCDLCGHRFTTEAGLSEEAA
jgi:hypothetical protein